MHILILTNILAPYRVGLFQSIRDHCEQLTVVLMSESHALREWSIDEHDLDCRILKGAHLRIPGREVPLHINKGILRTLKQCSPDLVISGGYGPTNIAAFLMCRQLDIPHVSWGELILDDGAQNSWLKRLVRRQIISKSCGCIASSSVSRRAFIHYGAKPENTLLSVMPIDVLRYANAARSYRKQAGFAGTRLVAIGRLVDYKGWRELFEIYKRLRKRLGNCHLTVIGDGPQMQHYKSWIEQGRLDDVHFVGHVSQQEICRHLAQSDIFIFPTLKEPFGAVISEAMACRTLCFISRFASAAEDLVTDGETGFVFDPTNADESVEKLLTVINFSIEHKNAVIENAYERVSSLDFKKSAIQITEFCRSMIRSHLSQGIE